MGRDLTAADNTPGAERVLLIGHGLWQRDFGGAPDIVGKEVRLNGKPATIIGVIKQDVTIDRAQAEFTGFARRFAEAYPDTNKQFSAARVEPLIDTFTPVQVRGLLLTMLAFCGGVLLIACVNVMNMQFARATVRAKELAVRSSLGASRMRIIRQMLTESLLVAAVGSAVGIGLAYLATDWVSAASRAGEDGPPAWMVFEVDGVALAFTAGLTVLAALASGLLPAWSATGASAVTALAEGGGGNTGGRVSLVTRGLVVLQIVTTCVLLIGSMLWLRSIVNVSHVDYGYDTAGIMSARMGLMDGDYPMTESRQLFYERLLRQLRSSPEFESVALTSRMRMTFGGSGPIEVEGKTYRERRDRPNANFEQVASGYFAVLGQRILQGRDFTDQDLDSRQPVAIVNAAFAEKHFGRASPLGRRFRTGDGSTPNFGPWRTIVGVVSTVRMNPPLNNPNVDESGFYVPFLSNPFGPILDAPFASQFATIIARPRPGQRPEALVPQLRKEVAKADPNLPIYFPGTPRHHLDDATSTIGIIEAMFTVLGAVAIALAAVGIYGVMSFSVSRRSQEFGVRMALGADRARILGMVMKQGARQVALGLVVGLGLARLVTTAGGEAMGALLFGVAPDDTLTYASVLLLVAGVSFVGLFVPARRATRIQPASALRAE